MRLEVWTDRDDLAYIYDDLGGRHTVALEYNGQNHSVHLRVIVCSDEITNLVNKFNSVRPAQYDYNSLLEDFRLFLCNPNMYHLYPKNDIDKLALRFCRLTESSASLTPIKIP